MAVDHLIYLHIFYIFMQRYSYISGAAKKSMIFFIAHAHNLQKQVPTFNFSHKNLLISALIRNSEQCSKVLPFDNKNKKIVFYFVLCSLIRTFVPDHRHIPQWRADVTFVGKQFKHSLLFRVQPKASETYWK